MRALVLMLAAMVLAACCTAGCGKKPPSAAEVAPFQAAIVEYLAAKSMDMTAKEFVSLEVKGDAATAVCEVPATAWDSCVSWARTGSEAAQRTASAVRARRCIVRRGDLVFIVVSPRLSPAVSFGLVAAPSRHKARVVPHAAGRDHRSVSHWKVGSLLVLSSWDDENGSGAGVGQDGAVPAGVSDSRSKIRSGAVVCSDYEIQASRLQGR